MASASITREKLDSLSNFRFESEAIPDGRYKVKCATEAEVRSDDDTVQSKLWFKTPTLDPITIRRLNSVQLFAESHDQGHADEKAAGNWTWFELAIFQNAEAAVPRVKDGIELVFLSHRNAFLTKDYQWCKGALFEETHDLIRLLEDGNVIGVRLCSRFGGWVIYARNGYLVVDIGDETLDRAPPPPYSKIISEITTIQDTIQEVNVHNGAAFHPSLTSNLFRADAFGTGDKRPLRVLSLDGGGVRGLVSLQLLKAVMDKVAPGKKPCEVFDMIAGTSTGGLIAIMLGRLQMTIDECIIKYKNVMHKVFPEGFSFLKKARLLIEGAFYDEEPLEQVIKELIKEKLDREDVRLYDPNNKGPCKIFVMAVRKDAANNRGPVFLRSYVNPHKRSMIPDIKIWEAARATSAAPAYFKPLSVSTANGTYELVDGGLGANNPLGWLWTEMLAVFGPARPTAAFLSIGTGMPPNEELPQMNNIISHATGSTAGAFASIATNTEIIHVLFKTLVNAFAPKPTCKKYWRLNVGTFKGDWDEKTGLIFQKTIHHMDDWEKIGDMDDVKAVEKLEIVAEKYIADNQRAITDCANALRLSLKE